MAQNITTPTTGGGADTNDLTVTNFFALCESVRRAIARQPNVDLQLTLQQINEGATTTSGLRVYVLEGNGHRVGWRNLAGENVDTSFHAPYNLPGIDWTKSRFADITIIRLSANRATPAVLAWMNNETNSRLLPRSRAQFSSQLRTWTFQMKRFSTSIPHNSTQLATNAQSLLQLLNILNESQEIVTVALVWGTNTFSSKGRWVSVDQNEDRVTMQGPQDNTDPTFFPDVDWTNQLNITVKMTIVKGHTKKRGLSQEALLDKSVMPWVRRKGKTNTWIIANERASPPAMALWCANVTEEILRIARRIAED